MSDYSNTFGGASKDTVNAVILGADHDTQYQNVADMSATKSNKLTAPVEDNLFSISGSGDLRDSGHSLSSLSTELIDKIYPVGSIYLSTTPDNPATLFGEGTWSRIAEGRTLIGEGTGVGLTERVAAAEGGLEDAVLPSHDHDFNDPGHSHGIVGSVLDGNDNTYDMGHYTNITQRQTQVATTDITINEQGVDPIDQNMQPYLVVYIWTRTA